MLQLAENRFPDIDSNRIAIYGVSRGGTVALLAGIRRPSINIVIAQAGPSNFLTKKAYYRTGIQYKYQFLSEKRTIRELREKILRSSPLHFIEYFPNRLYLVHGKIDATVPIEHADKIAQKLKHRSNFEYHPIQAGHQFSYAQQVSNWLSQFN